MDVRLSAHIIWFCFDNFYNRTIGSTYYITIKGAIDEIFNLIYRITVFQITEDFLIFAQLSYLFCSKINFQIILKNRF